MKTSEANMLDMTDVVNTIESVLTDFPPVTTEPQIERDDEIANLWSAHQNAKSTARTTREELRAIRVKLGERLHDMKKMLASPGRDGQWSGFLREHNIPRASADRLVIRHERRLNPNINRLIEANPEPTDEDVRKLFAAVWPKLRRTLRSPQSLAMFIDLLTSHYEGVEATDREILALAPPLPTICPTSLNGDCSAESETSAVQFLIASELSSGV
jgi:hypothetical protein